MRPHPRRPGRRPWSGLAGAVTALLVAAAGVTATASPALAAGSQVKVNQVAYVPGVPKRATLVTTQGTPSTWTLRNSSGTAVATGQTTVKGADADSGDTVQLIDFSSYDTPGTGYTLSVGSETSYPFDISADPIKKLRYDSLAFFYHQRSGIPIEAAYVGGTYARPAGHLNVAPNQGDNNVGCLSSCGYTLDVRGGWYDAGDQGKYVVNGGIAAWQLVDEYERAKALGDATALGDGKLAIPERANGVPDILDEARWEVAFLLKMQVPDGRANTGMAFHKIHDDQWTSLGTAPDQDGQPRHLHPVSTAATLNLAAVAGQCARVWKTLDAAFAATCLTAAEKAYAAAKANPAVYAPATDSTGGGAYDDRSVTDEFYWAAAELYATTGKDAYKTDLTGSSLYKGRSFNARGFDWGSVGALGDITLAIVPNGLPAADVAAVKSALTSTADTLLAQMNGQAYPAPYRETDGTYVWGSNGLIANNGMVLGLAYDLTQQAKYKNGVFDTVNYLLGRNPLNQSYVAGYGEQAVQNVHHRFWAHQLNASRPTAPPGAISGGPNSGLQDPVAASRLAGCKPQKCYVDDIEAYSVNEVAVNWQSAFAWLANWAAEKSGTTTTPPGDTPPTAPGTPVASGVTKNGATLTWTPATDDNGVARYDVLRVQGGTATTAGSTATTTLTLTGLTPATAYTFAVVALDTAGQVGPRSGTVTVTTLPDTGGTAACKVTYKANSWGGGFTGDVAIANTGTSAWSSWTLKFTFPGNQKITQGWSANWTQSGADVTATNLSWNGSLAPGQSTSAGFNGSYSGTNTPPAAFTVNGSTCAIG
ncbi:glycoside hydrolase family 9 protein [Sphaerisporangium sp. NPDC049003]|uniref:glycoside hydrolase family 9 protein n=1 Tax=Sphaerisporangium sp. NPDC049003 TaxID=3364517 RepID=UPI00371384DC